MNFRGPDARPPFRPEIEAIEQNGITGVALPHLDDPDVIPLWFGEGDRETPEIIRRASKEALDRGDTFYVHTRGRQSLRDAIKDYLDELYQIDVHPDRVSVPGSAMLGITIAAQFALSTGDHGIIVSPVWPNIDNVFRVTGAEVSHVRQRQTGSGWYLDLDDLRAELRPGTRAVFVNSPCNPTGWIMPPEQQRELLDLCRERGLVLIADEVYHRTVFERRAAPSFLEIAGDEDPVVVVNSFSKAWAMTGWRIGWVVAPRRHAVQWAALSECFNTGSTVFTQNSGIVALTEGEDFVRELQLQYGRGRDIVDRHLAGHPRLRYSTPEGAFYAFPEVEGLGDSLAFVEGVLAEEKVGLAPGFTFGPGNDGYFRLCFAQSHDRLEEAMARVVRYIDRHC
ncbi:MAG: pyridoxal phosphate-dependent aminotransferase [Thermoanaerobaculia bacterium]|nr:pyridoxal phosphate-dependent aminotransferase [Thermoanaerobaculia bacterium]